MGCTGMTGIDIAADNSVYYSDGNCIVEKGSKTLIYACKNSIIPKDIIIIAPYAFHDCSDWTSLTISKSVVSICDNAFYACGKLTSITYNGTKEQWNKIERANGWNNFTGDYTVYCTDGEISKADS